MMLLNYNLKPPILNYLCLTNGLNLNIDKSFFNKLWLLLCFYFYSSKVLLKCKAA